MLSGEGRELAGVEHVPSGESPQERGRCGVWVGAEGGGGKGEAIFHGQWTPDGERV